MTNFTTAYFAELLARAGIASELDSAIYQVFDKKVPVAFGVSTSEIPFLLDEVEVSHRTFSDLKSRLDRIKRLAVDRKEFSRYLSPLLATPRSASFLHEEMLIGIAAQDARFVAATDTSSAMTITVPQNYALVTGDLGGQMEGQRSPIDLCNHGLVAWNITFGLHPSEYKDLSVWVTNILAEASVAIVLKQLSRWVRAHASSKRLFGDRYPNVLSRLEDPLFSTVCRMSDSFVVLELAFVRALQLSFRENVVRASRVALSGEESTNNDSLTRDASGQRIIDLLKSEGHETIVAELGLTPERAFLLYEKFVDRTEPYLNRFESAFAVAAAA